MAWIPYRQGPGPDFVTADQAARIHELALRILREVGLEVGLPEVREQMARQGFRVDGERVFFEPAVVQEYLAQRRPREDRRRRRRETLAKDDGKLHLTAGVYAHHVHDLETDRIVPYTTSMLVEMTKLTDVLSERGLYTAAPGYPLDVAPALQPIVKYRVGALYSRWGEEPVDPISEASLPYVMDMAEALGRPLRHLPVYVFSPLRLSGESLQTAMRYRDRLEGISVGSMPSVGASVPILPFGALALAAAEAIGAFVTLTVVTGLPVGLGFGLHAFDLRHGTMVFGSPESYLFGQLNAEMGDYYTPWHRHERGHASAGIHSRANFPGPQAAAEKASLMTAGALAGARWFEGAGTLAVDEVFSPEQLLVDLEIKEHVERLIAGLDMSEGPYDWIEEVRRGVAGSFMAIDSTLDHYKETYWHPQLFDRGFLASQGPEGRMVLAGKAREMVAGYIARHEYELDGERRKEIDRIYERAVKEL